MQWDCSAFSDRYDVRRLTEDDIGQIYALCAGNPQFYAFHPPFVTEEDIREDLRALPPRCTPEDKYYVGFFDGNGLAAVLDLIVGYPGEADDWIGFFMLEAGRQGRGEGSRILSELLAVLEASGCVRVGLGVDRGNPQSAAFWKKNGFTPVPSEGKPYQIMERFLFMRRSR